MRRFENRFVVQSFLLRCVATPRMDAQLESPNNNDFDLLSDTEKIVADIKQVSAGG